MMLLLPRNFIPMSNLLLKFGMMPISASKVRRAFSTSSEFPDLRMTFTVGYFFRKALSMLRTCEAESAIILMLPANSRPVSEM